MAAPCRAPASSCSTRSGRGELPDAAEYGDEGSARSAIVARAVGGLDLPNLEQLGLGNVAPLEGCPPQPDAPALAGRLIERSKGKDSMTGHWELMGIVSAEPMPTYPHGFPFEIIEEFAHRPAGACSGTSPLGNEIIQELGEEHQPRASGSSTRRPTRSSRSRRTRRRSRSRSSTPPAIARDPDRAARRRARDRAAVRGRAGQLHAHTEPPRLVARCRRSRTT